MTAGSAVLGGHSGHFEADLLEAADALRGKKRTKYRTLSQGEQFALGPFLCQCLWPPDVVGGRAFGVAVERALLAYRRAKDEHPALRQLELAVRASRWFAAVAGESQVEVRPESYEPVGGTGTDLASEPLVKEANRRLRMAANAICVAFAIKDRLLFLGDIQGPRLAQVVSCVEEIGPVDFALWVAPHHGTTWHSSLRRLRAQSTIISVGHDLARKVKDPYRAVSKQVHRTLDRDVHVAC